MIRLAPELVPPGLGRPGRGFAWWYADLCADNGAAVVHIWARDLPFVPRATPSAGGSEHALVVAVYDAGRERFYALKTGDAVVEGAGIWRIGRSTIVTFERSGERTLHADIDIDVTGTGRVSGTIHMTGPALASEPRGDAPLAWSPVLVGGRAYARLSWDGGSAHLDGCGYFDGNAADRPLESLGIADWRWGRVAMPDRDLVYFALTPEGAAREPVCTVLTVDGRGRVEHHLGASRFRDGAPGWFGLRRASDLELAFGAERAAVTFDHQVEDGPFYQRYVVSARTHGGEVGRGVAERVVPSRLAQRWHRPLVNMRVDRAQPAARSLWLPLFAGASEGRVRRLLSTWLRGESMAVRP